jgi:hypothetical protein
VQIKLAQGARSRASFRCHCGENGGKKQPEWSEGGTNQQFKSAVHFAQCSDFAVMVVGEARETDADSAACPDISSAPEYHACDCLDGAKAFLVRPCTGGLCEAGKHHLVLFAIFPHPEMQHAVLLQKYSTERVRVSRQTYPGT